MNAEGSTSRGFTFIEIIAAIVLLGLFAVMSSSFFSNSVSKSVNPIKNLQSEISLQSCMEQVINNFQTGNYADLSAFLTYIETNPFIGCAIVSGSSHIVKLDTSTSTFVEDDKKQSNIAQVTVKSAGTSETLTVLLTK